MKNARYWHRTSLAVFISVLAVSADATTLIVNSTADDGTGMCTTSKCTLRDAVVSALPGDTILFSLSANSVITLTNGELVIDKDNITINGPGANLLTVQRTTANGAPTFRIFNTAANGNPPGITISGLTITNGMAAGSIGGGILNRGSLTLSNVTVSGNSASGPGGGIYHDVATDCGPTCVRVMQIFSCTISGNSAFEGGGIYNKTGYVALATSTISGNSAVDDGSSPGSGGGIYNTDRSSFVINSSTISGNSARIGGGGWDGGSSVSVGNTIIAGNTAPTCPDFCGTLASSGFNLIGNTSNTTITGTATGNQLNVDPLLGPLQDNGGATKTHALRAGSPAVDRGKTSSNSTDQRGFTRPVDDPTIANATGGDGSDIGAYEVQGDLLPGCGNNVVTNNADSGLGSLRFVIANVCVGENVTFASSVVSPIDLTSGELLIDKPTTIMGPGANKLTVQRSASAVNDARIFDITSTGSVTIAGLTIAKGKIANIGAGILNQNASNLTVTGCVITGNAAHSGSRAGSNGGGIDNESSGTVNLLNSTVSDNTATRDGAGIFTAAGIFNVKNSTISGNTAARSGGGIAAGGTVNLRSATIADNSANAGGGVHNLGTTINAANTILARNTTATIGPDCNGALTSQGFNFISDNAGASIGPAQITDQIGTAAMPKDPLLGPLQDNGGPTPTRALLVNSPAIDKGNSSGFGAGFADQRGFARPFDLGNIANVSGGDGGDIGAYEFNGLPLRITSITRPDSTHILLQGIGVPNAIYSVQASAELTPNSFEFLGSAAADVSGFWQYTDAPPAGLTRRFYRATFP